MGAVVVGEGDLRDGPPQLSDLAFGLFFPQSTLVLDSMCVFLHSFVCLPNQNVSTLGAGTVFYPQLEGA